MYIFFKVKYLNRSKNILECHPLLIALLLLILIDVDDEKFPTKIINEINEEIKKEDNYEFNPFLFKEKKNEQIKKLILSKLCPKINKEINEYKDLIKNLFFKEKDFDQLLDDKDYGLNININNEIKLIDLSEKLKYHYSKFLNISQFDERLFLIERNNTDCSPMKLTPIRRMSFGFNNLNSCEIIKKPYQKALNFGTTNNSNNDINNNIVNVILFILFLENE